MSATVALLQQTAHGVQNDAAVQTHKGHAIPICRRMTGGSAYTALGFGTTTIITYRPAPGYVENGSATTNNPHEACISHGSASNASSKCYWYNSSVDLDAKAEMYCSHRYY